MATSISEMLDSLAPKSRLKEFKSTSKEIKSKDLAIKIPAIKKCLEDHRYFHEGLCICPFIDGTVAKKVVNFSRLYILLTNIFNNRKR